MADRVLHVAGEFVPGTFLQRLNRFVARVEVAGQEATAHVPTSGRLGELLLPGAEVRLRPAGTANRKTAWDLMMVRTGRTWVSLDSRLPNHLVGQQLRRDDLPPFAGATGVRAEVAHGAGRLDFSFTDGQGQQVLMEVKSVTLVEEGVAMFPDAPSVRGARHLGELARAARDGWRATVLFIIQRGDAKVFRPNRRTDPDFSSALEQAVAAGVEVYAWRCRVDSGLLELLDRVEVKI